MIACDNTDFEPTHGVSPTVHLLDELQLYGYRPFCDEPDLDNLLWSTVNLFHRATERTEQQLDANETSQRGSQGRQDGSENRSVELGRLVAEGQSLIERRHTFEFLRDEAATRYERHTHSPWRPRTGSKVSHRHLTAAIIDSREFIGTRKRVDRELLLPAGLKVAVTGGSDYNDHATNWKRLERVHAKHRDMALLHGGSPRGAEFIASKWTTARSTPSRDEARAATTPMAGFMWRRLTLRRRR